jgi:[acyl-carrier-protein] S-malonyltransferase
MVNSKKIAFVFPGQGSQSLGMLAEISARYPQILETFNQAQTVLGWDLWSMTQNGPIEQLNQTQYTQPILLTASVALWRVFQDVLEMKPLLLAGHSLGEYSALVCAEVVSFEDALRIVAARGRYMQEAVPEGQGAMAVLVGLETDTITLICQQASQGEALAPANLNAPGQIVLSGTARAIDRALSLAASFKPKMAKRIAVSVPAHCVLMQPAADRLARILDTVRFSIPTIAVINNVDVDMSFDPDVIKLNLIRQMTHPVRWIETIQLMIQHQIELFVECGPGKVLAGLNKRITSTPTLDIMQSLQAMTDTLR